MWEKLSCSHSSSILYQLQLLPRAQQNVARISSLPPNCPPWKTRKRPGYIFTPIHVETRHFLETGSGSLSENFPTQNIPTRSRFGIGQYDRCLWKGFICKGCRYFLWLTMNELPVIGSLRLRTGFWDHHGANIATRLGYGERLFRRPKKWFWRGIIAFSPQFHHKLAKIMSIRGKCKFLS